jgi:hypothetical protein
MESKNMWKTVCLIILFVLAATNMALVGAEEEYHVITTLESSNPQGFGGYGGDIAFSEGLLLIGEWWGQVEEVREVGKAYLYDTEGNLISVLQAPEPKKTDEFSHSVDILGDIIIVGSHTTTVEGLLKAGEGYVFNTDGSLLSILQSPEPTGVGLFGMEVALGKDIILVAEPGVTVQGVPHAGKVHVYDTEGVYITNLTSPSMKSDGHFGYTLAASDEFIIVGEPGAIGANRPLVTSGVHVFDYDWDLVTTLQSPDDEERTFFGISTAINDDIVVIGEIWASVDGIDRAGKAHIFDTDWEHLATLQSTAPRAGGEFGRGTAVGGGLVVVGERRGDVINVKEGKAYVFDLEGNLLSTLVSSELEIGAQFGWRVETDGEIIVVSDVEATSGDVSKAGKVHVFGPGPSAETTTEEEPTETSSEPESKKEDKGIPGFPYESILLGIVSVILVLWSIERRR